VSGQLHATAALAPGKEPLGTHWIGGWVKNRHIGNDDSNHIQKSLPQYIHISLTVVAIVHIGKTPSMWGKCHNTFGRFLLSPL
jgi:hypothetical protein